MSGKESDRVLMAQIGAAHGIRGELRVKPFGDDPMALGDYGPLSDQAGKPFEIKSIRPQKSVVVVRFRGVDNRTQAEALTGTKLYLSRSALPPAQDDDEFYHIDLIGLPVFTVEKEPVGTVIAVPDFGAGDLLEVKPARGHSFLIPFTREIVPEIDLEAGRITVDPPEGMLVHQTKPDQAESES